MKADTTKKKQGDESKKLKVALAGNPNCGKSTLFNLLTGLNQKIGNFPGVTVEKKTGYFVHDNVKVEITDLPGAYSMSPRSLDEKVCFDILSNSADPLFPDIILYLADASNLRRSLYLCSQIIDLQLPVILVLNMMDVAEKKGIYIDHQLLGKQIGIPVVSANCRKSIGIDNIRKTLNAPILPTGKAFTDFSVLSSGMMDKLRLVTGASTDSGAIRIAGSPSLKSRIGLNGEVDHLLQENNYSASKLSLEESRLRYSKIDSIIRDCVVVKDLHLPESFTHKIDNIVTHKVWGIVIFLMILLAVFQTIFVMAEYPMQWIESAFLMLADFASHSLPPGELNGLISNGIIAGLSGIAVFIPQIALLMFFIALLEDTGYMARVSFIMDKMMRKFGLNGRSVIPLISGMACAVPAIISARTIASPKERLITILVTPLMSCSARLPVYTLLIAMVVPSQYILGIINLKGLMLMGLYLIGFVAAIGSAWIMKTVLRSKERSYFIMELPDYHSPRWSNVLLTVFDKVKIFLFQAGKIILAVSIVLWVLASHAPSDTFEKIENKYAEAYPGGIEDPAIEKEMASEKLKSSYAGIMGRSIEPAIAPLGFDWKIGIALVTSFAAREVFVGTMATIYSVGDEENIASVREKMMVEINPATGKPRYSFAVGLSLMLFYAFAMQCMSTLAASYSETRSIKVPVFQFFYMGTLAWLASFVAFQLFK